VLKAKIGGTASKRGFNGKQALEPLNAVENENFATEKTSIAIV
jgi:hypothetical protein